MGKKNTQKGHDMDGETSAMPKNVEGWTAEFSNMGIFRKKLQTTFPICGLVHEVSNQKAACSRSIERNEQLHIN